MDKIDWDTDLSKLDPDDISQWMNDRRADSSEADSPFYSLHQSLMSWMMWGHIPEDSRPFVLPNTLRELRNLADQDHD